MPDAFDDEAQIVLAGEVNVGDDVAGRFRGDGIDARLRSPCIEPTGGLRQPDLVGDVIGVSQPGEDIVARPTGSSNGALCSMSFR
jgi:hypothetical protein